MDNNPVPPDVMNMVSSSIVHSYTVITIPVHGSVRVIKLINICINSDPSATKICPVEAIATDVGLQKCPASFPGTNASPRTTNNYLNK